MNAPTYGPPQRYQKPEDFPDKPIPHYVQVGKKMKVNPAWLRAKFEGCFVFR